MPEHEAKEVPFRAEILGRIYIIPARKAKEWIGKKEFNIDVKRKGTEKTTVREWQAEMKLRKPLPPPRFDRIL